MGLLQRTTNFQYVKLVDGKFFLSSDKEKKTPFDELSGLISDIGIRTDTYEGQKVTKIYLIMDSDGEAYNLSFNIDGSYASTFMSFIKNADITRELTLVPVLKMETKDGQEVKRLSLLIKQDNDYIKAYYTKDNPRGLPQMVKLTLNGKTVWDRTEVILFFQEIINNELRPIVKQTVIVNEAPTPKTITSDSSEVAEREVVTVDDDADDLPF